MRPAALRIAAAGRSRFAAAFALAIGSALVAGCGVRDLQTPFRYQQGLVIVLPGIEGQSGLNASIARGLARGGVPSAIEIYDWTLAGTASWLINLAGESRNRQHAERLALRIVAYQKQHPGRPVHLIGHSGGGGVAVFALEALPADRPVTGALLLAPALSPEYDLTRALQRTRHGIWNFYSGQDVGFLGVGTTLFGTIDREHGAAAGAVGFREPATLKPEGRRYYRTRLHQVRYTPRMARSGHGGGHTGWASQEFAREWLAPLIYAQVEPSPAPPRTNMPARRRIESGSEASSPAEPDKSFSINHCYIDIYKNVQDCTCRCGGFVVSSW